MKNNLGTFFGLSRWGAGAVVLASCALISSRAYGGLVAEWDLNAPSYTGGTPTAIQADFGSQAGSASTTLNGSATGSGIFSAGTPGTATVNSPSSGTAGNAIVMAIFGTPSTMTLTFHLVGTGLSDFVMTYATQEPDIYNESQSWSWSTSGSSYTSLTSVQPGANSTWGAQSIDFSTATDLNNASDVYLQLQVSNSDIPQIWFDNFKINAVPEVPMTGVVMGFGALAIAVGHTLRRKLRPAVSSIA